MQSKEGKRRKEGKRGKRKRALPKTKMPNFHFATDCAKLKEEREEQTRELSDPSVAEGKLFLRFLHADKKVDTLFVSPEVRIEDLNEYVQAKFGCACCEPVIKIFEVGLKRLWNQQDIKEGAVGSLWLVNPDGSLQDKVVIAPGPEDSTPEAASPSVSSPVLEEPTRGGRDGESPLLAEPKPTLVQRFGSWNGLSK
jgi:hypothetical protein